MKQINVDDSQAVSEWSCAGSSPVVADPEPQSTPSQTSSHDIQPSLSRRPSRRVSKSMDVFSLQLNTSGGALLEWRVTILP